MNNIYEVWRNFNRNQESLKGPLSNMWLERVKDSSEQWQNKLYPKGEYWKYVKFGDLETTKLHSAVAAENSDAMGISQGDIKVYINNFSDLTDIKSIQLPKGLNIYTHKEVMESEELSAQVKPLLRSTGQNNPFSETALSFLGLGLFIVVDSGTTLKESIHITFDLNSFKSKDVFAPFSLQVLIQEKAKVKLFIETQAEQFVGLSNIRFDSQIESEAELNVYFKEAGGAQSRTINNNFIDIKKDGKLNFFDLTLPGQWSRHNTTASLAEVNAEATVNGIYLNNNNYFCDHHTEIQHLKEHTTSHQNYKGILSDSARAVFSGKVFIEKMARKSSSNQLNKNLMLSKKAEIDTKPELQIYNDDVKAAHGATIGKIDDEQLFYLQSRGYTLNAAWRVLAKAFVFDSVENEEASVKSFLGKDMIKALSQFEDL